MDCFPLPILPSGTETQLTLTLLALTYPQITLLQYSKPINDAIYGMGKTSGTSPFNIPGRIGWITMEVPGFITLLYCMNTIPAGGITSLPWENKALCGIFVCLSPALYLNQY